MRKKINILYIFAIGLLAGCVQEVPVDLPAYSSKLVVNAIISDQDSSFAQISESISSLDTNQIDFINQASVRLFDGNNALYDILGYNSFSGGFVGTKPVQKNTLYTLKVNYKDKAIQAKTRILSGADIVDFKYIDSVGLDTSGFKLGRVSFSFADIAGQDNYYRIQLFYWDDLRQTFEPYDLGSNEFIEAEAELTDKGYVFDDETFRGKLNTIDVDVPFGFVDDAAPYKFLVKLEALNNDLTLYEKSRELYQNSFGGFFTEPVDLYSNIEGGLGIFGGAVTNRDTLR